MKTLLRTPKEKFRVIMMMISFSLLLVSCNNNTGTSDKEPASDSKKQATIKTPSTDIHTAVILGDLDVIQQHIQAGTDLNTKEPTVGSTPLISSIVFGRNEIAMALINAGADINMINNDGSSPLYCAAFFGRTEIAGVLLEKGADTSIRNNFGSTALETVSVPFSDVKMIYDQISKDMGPLGFKLDYDELQIARNDIAELLR